MPKKHSRAEQRKKLNLLAKRQRLSVAELKRRLSLMEVVKSIPLLFHRMILWWHMISAMATRVWGSQWSKRLRETIPPQQLRSCELLHKRNRIFHKL
jgi:hypothetical protein